jgi:hypothetical protein
MRVSSFVAKPFLLRGLWLWLVIRAPITILFVLTGADGLNLAASAQGEVVILVVALGWIETLRRRERALLGNLSVSPALLSAFFVVPALLAEGLLRTAAAILA